MTRYNSAARSGSGARKAMSIPQASSVKVHACFGVEGIFGGTRGRRADRLTGAPVSLPLRDARGRREKPAVPPGFVRRLDISYDKSKHLERFVSTSEMKRRAHAFSPRHVRSTPFALQDEGSPEVRIAHAILSFPHGHLRFT